MIVVADLSGQPATNISADLNSAHRLLSSAEMNNLDLFTELLATYRKYGWELKGALLTPSTRAELTDDADLTMVPVKDASFDALWFSRPSHKKREAWELRLLAETQYALFESFEPDETQEQREEARLEMEARMREYVH